MREADSFGFVIKSSCPAFIESIDPGGAAEKAGLLAGDYIIKLNGIDVRYVSLLLLIFFNDIILCKTDSR